MSRARPVQTVTAMSVVAVFSADEDTVLLRPLLRGAGHQVVGAYIRELRRGDVDPSGSFVTSSRTSSSTMSSRR